MNNATEVYQPEYGQLSLPAATMVVHVNDALCEDLEVIEIVRSEWPEFGWAKLAYNASCVNPSGIGPKRVEDRFAMGRTISLRQFYHREPSDAVVGDLPLFVGQIEGIETTVGAEKDEIEVIAKDFSAILRRITVYGERVLHSGGVTVPLLGFETTFNPLGRGNASIESASVDGRHYTVFSASTTETKAWTCADAIHYLLSEYVPVDMLSWPDLRQLLALTESCVLRDLDVSGLSLLEALHRCCEEAGIRFQFVPRPVETGPAQAVVFYPSTRGRLVELNCQLPGESLSLSRTSVCTLHSERTVSPITHRYVGQGDFKVYEGTFELIRAWDPALEGTDYSIFSASTNPEFHRVKDVYRRWCLNEASDYSGQPYNQGASYDFSRLFERRDYVARRRRFWPTLTTDMHGRALGYFLQVSFDSGLHWWEYNHAFNNLLDECGVWLSSDQLDVDTWVAALKGALRMRITASVVSDERLTCIVADGPVGSTIPTVDHVLTLPRRFAYRQVSPQSIFARMASTGLGTPDEADDSTELHRLVCRYARTSSAIIATIDVQTPTLRLHLHPGDRATSSPESRDILNCRGDSRSTVSIERVHIDFRKQCTNLRLVRQRLYEG